MAEETWRSGHAWLQTKMSGRLSRKDELASGLTDRATPLLLRRQQFHLRLQQADLGLTLVGWSINSSTDVISLRAKRAA